MTLPRSDLFERKARVEKAKSRRESGMKDAHDLRKCGNTWAYIAHFLNVSSYTASNWADRYKRKIERLGNK